MGAEAFIETAPEAFKSYLTIDTEKMGRELETELMVLDGSDGRLHIFDPRQ
jgi:hypothetical protein